MARMRSFRESLGRLWIKPAAQKVYRWMGKDDQEYEADCVKFGTHSLTTESVKGRVGPSCGGARSAVLSRACLAAHTERRVQPAQKRPIQAIECRGQQCEDQKRSNHVHALLYPLHRALNKIGI